MVIGSLSQNNTTNLLKLKYTAQWQNSKRFKKSGVIDKTTMRKFDALCLTTVHEFTPTQVRNQRLKYNLSRPVFVQYFNVSDKLVKKMGTRG